MSYFFDRCFDKKRVRKLLLWIYRQKGAYSTLQLVEKLKVIGFHYATKSGLSIGLEDLRLKIHKSGLITESDLEIQTLEFLDTISAITKFEKLQQSITAWLTKNEFVKAKIINNFKICPELNPIFLMSFSGARGNISQVRQLVGMRGLMSDPQGNILDFPIRSNFNEGLTLVEYLVSCYGARKGIVDTALRTATSGYLTRRLVDVAQHVIVSQADCGTSHCLWIDDLYDEQGLVSSRKSRILGRVLAKSIIDQNNHIKVPLNTQITPHIASYLVDQLKLPRIPIRTPLTCESHNSVCQLCYGWSLAAQKLVSIGEAVGVIAAQSIGEPGTQLTMRTFHTGGVVSAELVQQIYSPIEGKTRFEGELIGCLVRTRIGRLAFLTKQPLGLSIQNEREARLLYIPSQSIVYIKNGQFVPRYGLVAQLNVFTELSTIGDKIYVEQDLRVETSTQIFFENLLVSEKRKYNLLVKQYTQSLGTVWLAKILNYHLLAQIPVIPKYLDIIHNDVLLQKMDLIIHQKHEYQPFNAQLNLIDNALDHEHNFSNIQYFFTCQNYLNYFLIIYSKRHYLFIKNYSEYNHPLLKSQSKLCFFTVTSGIQDSNLYRFIQFKYYYIYLVTTHYIYNYKFKLGVLTFKSKLKNNPPIRFVQPSIQTQYYFWMPSKPSKRNALDTFKWRVFVPFRAKKKKVSVYRTKFYFQILIKHSSLPIAKYNRLSSSEIEIEKNSLFGIQTQIKNNHFFITRPFIFDFILKLKLRRRRKRRFISKFIRNKRLFTPNLKLTSFWFALMNVNQLSVNDKFVQFDLNRLKYNRLFNINSHFYIILRRFIKPKLRKRQKNKTKIRYIDPKKIELIYWFQLMTIFHNAQHWKNRTTRFKVCKSFDLECFRVYKKNLFYTDKSALNSRHSFISDYYKKQNYYFNKLDQSSLVSPSVRFPKLYQVRHLNQYYHRCRLEEHQKPQLLLPIISLDPQCYQWRYLNQINIINIYKLQFDKLCNNPLIDKQINNLVFKLLLKKRGPFILRFQFNWKLNILESECVVDTYSLSNDQSFHTLPIDHYIAYSNQYFSDFKIGHFVHAHDLKSTLLPFQGQVYAKTLDTIILRKGESRLLTSNGILHASHRSVLKPKARFFTGFYSYFKKGDIVQGIPKIEEFFEARSIQRDQYLSLQNQLRAFYRKYKCQYSRHIAIRKSISKIQRIIIEQIQLIYRSQGVFINEKHLEIIIRQMTSKVRITDNASTGLLVGEVVELKWVEKINSKILVNQIQYEPAVLGITKSCLETNSFISAASFQETVRVLTDSAMYNKLDFLGGLKENIILGHLIPAGTGLISF